MTDVIAVVADLIFATKITGTARACGLEAKSVASAEALSAELARGRPRLIIVDMDLAGDSAVRALQTAAKLNPPPAIVAYYSHVRVEQSEAAQAAGATLVVPRSKLSAELPQLFVRCCPPTSGATAET